MLQGEHTLPGSNQAVVKAELALSEAAQAALSAK